MTPSIITKESFKQDPLLFDKLKKSVFIYPTDTIYGLGCDARDYRLVQRLREIKKRYETPFSIIAPTKKWIELNCHLTVFARDYLDKLPGSYTLLLNARFGVAENVNPTGKTLGVRMLKSWFQDIVHKLNIPIITTSVNIHGNPFMTSLADLDKEIFDKVDYIIDDDQLRGKPSTIISLTGTHPKILKR